MLHVVGNYEWLTICDLKVKRKCKSANMTTTEIYNVTGYELAFFKIKSRILILVQNHH